MAPGTTNDRQSISGENLGSVGVQERHPGGNLESMKSKERSGDTSLVYVNFH